MAQMKQIYVEVSLILQAGQGGEARAVRHLKHLDFRNPIDQVAGVRKINASNVGRRYRRRK
jgi:hypothetical protein